MKRTLINFGLGLSWCPVDNLRLVADLDGDIESRCQGGDLVLATSDTKSCLVLEVVAQYPPEKRELGLAIEEE